MKIRIGLEIKLLQPKPGTSSHFHDEMGGIFHFLCLALSLAVWLLEVCSSESKLGL